MKTVKTITFQVSTVYPKSNPSDASFAVATFIRKRKGAFIPETDANGTPLKDENNKPIGSYGAPKIERYGISISKTQYTSWLPRLMSTEVDEESGEVLNIVPKEEPDVIYSAIPIYNEELNPLGTFDVIVSENTYEVNGESRTGLNRYIVTRNVD
jgi:hypothetical protein